MHRGRESFLWLPASCSSTLLLVIPESSVPLLLGLLSLSQLTDDCETSFSFSWACWISGASCLYCAMYSPNDGFCSCADMPWDLKGMSFSIMKRYVRDCLKGRILTFPIKVVERAFGHEVVAAGGSLLFVLFWVENRDWQTFCWQLWIPLWLWVYVQ